MIRHVTQGYACSCPLSKAVVRTMLMLTSNEHIVFRTTTNDDLCNFLRSFCGFLLHEPQNKYFKLKNSWDCCPNPNYLLSSVASQDTAICQKNATTYVYPYRKYGHTVSLRNGHTDTDRLCIHFTFFESFLIWSCTG